jgi:hypothetical protein
MSSVGNVNDVYSKYDLHTRRNTSVSLEVNYCDIAVALLREIIKKGRIAKYYMLHQQKHGAPRAPYAPENFSTKIL